MKRALPLFILSVAISLITASAQQKRTMTFEDVLAIKNVSDPQVSPDGRWVAYVVTSADMKENAADADIWLVSAQGGEPVRLTTSKKSDNQPRWSPDGKRLAFISAREEKPQIFLISPFGGEAERLTDSKSGVQSFQWSPDNRSIAYASLQEPTPEEEKRQKDKDDAQVVDKNFKFSRIWVLDVQTKKATELVKGDFSAADPQWSPDGSSIAFTTTPTPKADDSSLTDIWIIDVAPALDTETAELLKQLGELTTRRTELESSYGPDNPRVMGVQGEIAALRKRIDARTGLRKLVENEGPDNSPRWSPDGRWIAYLSRDVKNGLLGQQKLTIVSAYTSAADGGVPRLVARKFEYQPGPAVWSADGSTAYFTSPVRTTTQLFSVPAGGGEPQQLSRVEGVMSQPSFSRNRAVVAFTRSDTRHPSDVFVAKLPDMTNGVKLTDHNPQVRELALGASEVIRWKSNDGQEIEGLVVYPVGYQPNKRYPMVALIHGGPSGVWSQSFPAGWGNFGHVWAGKGWVAFYPNVRGSSAYGEKFLLSNVRDWGGGDYQDIQSGIDHLVAKGIADPDKLAQSGWSYGGYMTAWTLTQTTRFKAVMVGAGLTNMYSMYSTNDLQRILEGYFGGQPWDDAEAYWRKSAMAFIKKAKTPTLILHGAADSRVPPSQAQELYMGLRKTGVPVELVFFPREPHGLQEPRHQLDKMRREYSWFSRHVLGVGASEPRPETEKKGEKTEKPSASH